MTKKVFGAATALALAALATSPAQAAEVISINLLNQTSTTGGSGYGNAFKYATTLDGTPLNLEVTAWTLRSNAVENAKLVEYSGGLGITNRYTDSGSPQHAIDNQNGQDFLVLKFDRAVDINSFRVNWAETDPDVSVLWGNVDPATALGGMSAANFYNLFGSNLQEIDANVGSYTGISGENSGNWWVLGALDTVDSYLSCSGYRNKNCTTKYQYDYFKIDKIKLEGGLAVPEPSTWLMMILGIGAAGGVMRRRNKVSVRFDTAAAA